MPSSFLSATPATASPTVATGFVLPRSRVPQDRCLRPKAVSRNAGALNRKSAVVDTPSIVGRELAQTRVRIPGVMTLVKKLQIKDGQTVLIANAPSDVELALPAQVATDDAAAADAVVAFVARAA